MMIRSPLTKALGPSCGTVMFPNISSRCSHRLSHTHCSFSTTSVEREMGKYSFGTAGRALCRRDTTTAAKVRVPCVWRPGKLRCAVTLPILALPGQKRHSHSRMTNPQKSKQRHIPASYYRGGTSRAPIFLQKDLPVDRRDWAPIFRGVIGSPDPNGRQLDGLGGGISSLSKICVVGPPTHPKAHADFTFVQLGIKDDEVDYSGNCGNMLAAIGPFVIDSGMVEAKVDGEITVVINNTNTNKLIESTFEVLDGEAVADGDFAIDGVAGTGSKIQLGFLDPAGSKTGSLLPTGNVVDEFDRVKTTCIDAGNPCCFVTAESMGIDGTILPEAVDAHPDLLRRLDSIRRQASVAMGVSTDLESTPGAIPKISMVSRPTTHSLLSGELLQATAVDLVVRAISGGNPHRAVPMTVALSLAAASSVKDSVVAALLGAKRVDDDGLTIGHASGKMLVAATFDDQRNLTKATVFRTARRLMSGLVYWKGDRSLD